MILRYASLLMAAVLTLPCCAQDTPKAVIALVGDFDRFTIGQQGYCGERSEISDPGGKQFRIPAHALTYFYIKSKTHTVMGSYTCEGDFSFMPAPGLLHVIRYSVDGKQCSLEMFQSVAGGTPQRMPVHREENRSCLIEK